MSDAARARRGRLGVIVRDSILRMPASGSTGTRPVTTHHLVNERSTPMYSFTVKLETRRDSREYGPRWITTVGGAANARAAPSTAERH